MAEGTWGTVIFAFVLPTLMYVFKQDPNAPEGVIKYISIESFVQFGYQCMQRKELIAYTVLYVFTIIFYSFSGL